jgi:dihydropteroate synthase
LERTTAEVERLISFIPTGDDPSGMQDPQTAFRSAVEARLRKGESKAVAVNTSVADMGKGFCPKILPGFWIGP